MSSVIIELRRKPNFTRLPEISAQQSRRKVGCTMTRNGAQNHGLTPEEVKKYLPEILNISADEVSFRAAVTEYFHTLTIDVKDEGGIKLEIGVDDKGEPLNVADWIKYKFASANPYVASDIEALHRDSRKLFYFHNRISDIEKKAKASNRKAAAYKLLLQIQESATKTPLVLTVLGVNPSRVVAGLPANKHADALKVRLEEEYEKDMEAFYTAASNPHLETIALLETAVSASIVERVGSSYFHNETDLGGDLREAVAYLEDKKNSGVVAQIKAQLKAIPV
jgi:hypothetical protein